MIKKILPTMIGVALAGGMTAASADVQIFGHIDESILHNDNISTSDGKVTDTNLVCTTCSIGFKGSEDLGNGLKAIFSLDWQYDINNRNPQTVSFYTTSESGYLTTVPTSSAYKVASITTNNALTDRDQWVGLAGGFGQVRVGTISTSYKSHGAMIDPGYRTVAQMRDVGIQSMLHNGAGEEGQGRATNTFRWDSPDFNGAKITATYTLDSGKSNGEDDNPYGIGAQYQNGGILVYADYLTNDRGGDDSAWKIGGKYAMDNFSVFGQYEVDDGLISQSNMSTLGLTSNNSVNGADVWMLGGSFTMDANTVYAAYGNGDDDNQASNGDQGYSSWELVGVHGFSKSTLVYGGYVNVSPDQTGADDTNLWTVGLKKTF